jgi:hypothetical protein
MTSVFEAFRSLRDIDWDDVGSVLAGSASVFNAFESDSETVPALLGQVADDVHLQSMCERFDFLDKLVVHDDREAEVRVRIHLFREGYYDRPHNHRWTFASLLLCGSYVHRLFGRDDVLREDTDADSLSPILERTENVGSRYALHHNSVHTVQAAADTISIVVRGPAAKDRFLILDRISRGSFWAYGAEQESAELRASKTMTAAERVEASARVVDLATRRFVTATI